MSNVVPQTPPAAQDGGTPAPAPAQPVPTLAYEPAGPAARAMARRVRWGMAVLGAWLVGTVLLYNPLTGLWQPLGMGLYGTPLVPVDGGRDDSSLKVQYLLTTAGYLGALLLAQGLFLLPRGPLALRLVERGRPMRRALLMAVAGGMIAMLLTAGLVATLLDWPGWWVPLWEEAGVAAGAARLRPLYGVWLAMLALWAAWAWVFFRYFRDRDHRTAAARVTRALLAGTVLELLVSGPAHVWALRKHSGDPYDCYCARGSYTGLVFGCTALVWLFGPGVLLLVLREKRRREEIVADRG